MVDQEKVREGVRLAGVTFPPVTLSGINQAMVDSIAKVLQEGKTAEEAASWLSDAVNASLQENGELSE